MWYKACLTVAASRKGQPLHNSQLKASQQAWHYKSKAILSISPSSLTMGPRLTAPPPPFPPYFIYPFHFCPWKRVNNESQGERQRRSVSLEPPGYSDDVQSSLCLLPANRYQADPFQAEQWFQCHQRQWHGEEVRRPEGAEAVSPPQGWWTEGGWGRGGHGETISAVIIFCSPTLPLSDSPKGRKKTNILWFVLQKVLKASISSGSRYKCYHI